MSAAIDPRELCELATSVAREAGALLLDRVGELDVTTKSSRTDVVTDKDRASERLIRSRLRTARPDDALLGEEGGASGAADATVRWIVDPIDGTVNYLYGIPQFAVSIAAEVRGEVVAGVVLDPCADEVYTATRDGGAACNGVPITCSAAADLALALVATGFSYSAERRRRQAGVLVSLLPAVRDIRRCGSAALDLCAVARGRVDAYYEKGVSAWDIAAGALVAREAGAVVEVASSDGYVLAAAPGVHDGLAALLAAAGMAEV